ncbi:MAG: hypothetical protein ABI147_08500, partial [Acidobacteriaceae bacterium]
MPTFNVIETRSKLPSVLIASGVLVLIAVAVFHFNRDKKPELTVTRVQTYIARTELKAMKGSIHVIGTTPHVDNDLYVLLTVKLTDTTRQPLFIKDETSILTAPDHSILESSAVQKSDFAQIYAAFPALQALASTPLSRDTKVDPGQTAEGMVLLHFPGATEANW